ncbi:MAG TPA: NAD-dependent epimerase/dehydratase family protein [Chlamydiales bacterium]|nr:NAD-dependent epimerase/dehydratase family protein [Chlamydiales bacterium]
MKKVLITGAAGFIGFHLALALKKQGDLVIGYDNFNAYYDPRLKRKREAKLQENKIPIIEGDICEEDFLFHLLKKEEITHVVHLAAQAGVRHSLTHPEEYVKANLKGFHAVLEACRKIPRLRLVYASSSSVYGKNTKIPFSESDPSDLPGNFYGATKKSGELMATSYHHLFGLPTIGLRFFTVYGPWGRPDMAYFHFANSIRQGKPIQVFNHGQMKRDFTYIDDIVAGTMAALNLKQNHEIINLGGNRPMPLLTLIQLLEIGLKKKAILEMLPMQPGEAVETFADISKAQKLLGFQPKTTLEEGIDKFLSWYLKNY